ncbi:MAG: GGDEF domain-containing protein [Rubrivivax sp.]|nr:GGDEF domain-containing protein [Rubrivivax sp.]
MQEQPPTAVIDPNAVALLRTVGTATKPCFVLYSGPDAGQRFDLGPGVQTIGRVPEAQLRIDAAGVSRHHAELQVGPDGVTIRDLGSSNGTRVNETPITEATLLKDGDLVRLSDVVLRFHTTNSLELLLHDHIYQQTIVDAGTGAYNRKFLIDTLKQAYARARASGRPLSVIAYDLDHFKTVNDTYGHAAGDTVLQITTKIARSELRSPDTLGRVGGEEFTIVMENTPVAAAVEAAERIRAAMAQFPIELPDPVNKQTTRPVEHHQTVSIGVAELTPEMSSERELLEAADRALYQSKRRGRNQVSL